MAKQRVDIMVAPQQRKQVVVKSIGEIERESTVRARPMGSRAMGAAAAGIKAGQNIAGVMDTFSSAYSGVKKGLGMYGGLSQNRLNFMLLGAALATDIRRLRTPGDKTLFIPDGTGSIFSNIITGKYLFVAHLVYSTGMAGYNATFGGK